MFVQEKVVKAQSFLDKPSTETHHGTGFQVQKQIPFEKRGNLQPFNVQEHYFQFQTTVEDSMCDDLCRCFSKGLGPSLSLKEHPDPSSTSGFC